MSSSVRASRLLWVPVLLGGLVSVATSPLTAGWWPEGFGPPLGAVGTGSPVWVGLAVLATSALSGAWAARVASGTRDQVRWQAAIAGAVAALVSVSSTTVAAVMAWSTTGVVERVRDGSDPERMAQHLVEMLVQMAWSGIGLTLAAAGLGGLCGVMAGMKVEREETPGSAAPVRLGLSDPARGYLVVLALFQLFVTAVALGVLTDSIVAQATAEVPLAPGVAVWSVLGLLLWAFLPALGTAPILLDLGARLRPTRGGGALVALAWALGAVGVFVASGISVPAGVFALFAVLPLLGGLTAGWRRGPRATAEASWWPRWHLHGPGVSWWQGAVDDACWVVAGQALLTWPLLSYGLVAAVVPVQLIVPMTQGTALGPASEGVEAELVQAMAASQLLQLAGVLPVFLGIGALVWLGRRWPGASPAAGGPRGS